MSQPSPIISGAQSFPSQSGLSHQSKNVNKSFSDLFSAQVSASPDIAVKQPSSFRGKPAVFFSSDDIQTLAAPLRFALIGKFTHGRPPINEIRSIIDSIGIKGSHVTGVIDHKHILIRFTLEADFQKFWCKDQWFIKRYPMRVFKWSPDFTPNQESPLVPVWITLPGLPLHLYSKSALFSIGCNIGSPMKLDHATYSLSRPSLARMCIELDVSSDLPASIWIGSAEVNEDGFWQQIVYEKVPNYCDICFKLGHSKNACFISNPQAAPKKNLATSTTKINGSKPALSYVPKQVNKDNLPVGNVSIPVDSQGIIQTFSNADNDKIDQVIVDLVNSDVSQFSVEKECVDNAVVNFNNGQHDTGLEDNISEHSVVPISATLELDTSQSFEDNISEQQFIAGEWDNFITGEKTSDIFKAIPSLIDKRRLQSRNYIAAMDLHVRSCKVNFSLSLDELKMTLPRDSASIASAILRKFPIADEAFTPVTRRRKKKKQSPARTSVVTRAAAKTLFSFPPKP